MHVSRLWQQILYPKKTVKKKVHINGGPSCPTVLTRQASRSLPVDDRPRVLDKVVDEDGPGPFLVVVAKVVVDGGGEVEEKVPGIFGNASVVVLFQKGAPQGQKLEPVEADE